MLGARVWALLALPALLASGACARTREYIGQLPSAGGGGTDGTDAGDAAADGDAAASPWNCGERCFRAPGVAQPGTAPFDLPADTAVADHPSWAYPLPGAVLPVNLGSLDLQWRRALDTQTSFRVRIEFPGFRFDLFIPCDHAPMVPVPAAAAPQNCVFAVPTGVWNAIAAEARGSLTSFTITASDPNRGVTSSAAMSIELSEAALEGGFYYWTSKTLGIERALLGGKTSQSVVPGSSPVASGFGCAGCHVPSRDGSKLAFTLDQDTYPIDGNLAVVDVAAPATPLLEPPGPTVRGDAGTMSFNPAGTLLAVSGGATGDSGHLVVRDAVSGAVVARLGAASLQGAPGTRVYFPDWSPSGDEIVATVASDEDRPFSVKDGSIVIWSFDGTNFGPAQVLINHGFNEFHYAPAFSPDGQYVVFVTAPLGVRSYENVNGRLRLIARSGGVVRELTLATQAVGKKVSFPRFVPIREAGGTRFYVSFGSRMDYGFLGANSLYPNGGLTQQWLAAIDVRKAGDPSGAPVWLPFQDTGFHNLLGIWSDKLVCGPQSPCALGTTCQGGRCVLVGR